MKATLVIFGGTGDLTHRKILPALYNLAHDGLLPNDFAIVAIGRRPYTTDEYRQEVHKSTEKYSRLKIKDDLWDKLSSRLYYYQMDFTTNVGYPELELYLQQIAKTHNTEDKRIYYLAVAPEFFGIISKNLRSDGMQNINGTWPRIVIEKPFGRDLASAISLNNEIVNAFGESNVYRIDHYLGKEMLQNIMVIRFANSMFEPLWNNSHIKQVQITAFETEGIGTRGNYYETSGAIRDMAQSHLLQLLSLIAMERPDSLDAELIRDEKVRILKSLRQYDADDVNKMVVRGQYQSYRQEKNVDPSSHVETYVAFKALIDSPRWEGVPFFIRTGKKMANKTTEIIVEFNEPDNSLYGITHMSSNYLVIKVQPQEGIFIQFNAKKPGAAQEIVPVKMDFCQNCQVGINSPEAYERLLYDVIRGDATLFARWDEVYYSWVFIDKIIQSWEKETPNFPNYKDGGWGPKEAQLMLQKNNLGWIIIDE